jgi:hypothetical protein
VRTTGDLTIIRHEDGSLTLDGFAPPFVAFATELLDEVRAGASAPWCTIDGDTITIRLSPLTLRYRLTGELDVTGSPVAQRVDEDGAPWRT